MFEILSVLILYSRGDLEERFQYMFDLYCYSEDVYMKQDEFKFMIEKLITILSSTLQIKRGYLSDIYKAVENKLVLSKDKI